MKRFAVRGLLILVGVVLVCVFFSGTLHSITTAKVQMAKAKTGKLTSEISLTGSLYWPATEPVFVEGMKSEDLLTIRRMNVAPGSWVNAGDLIAVCEVSDADTRLAALQLSYSDKENEYLELERKNRMAQLTPQQKNWYRSYQALKSSRRAEQEALQEARLAAWKAGVALESGDALPEGAADLSARRQEAEAAQSAFDSVNLLPISDDTVSYLEKKADLEAEMDDLSGQMTDLRILKEAAAAIRAPHDGYITAADLKAGDTLSRSAALVQMTQDSVLPVIRLETGANRKTFTPGMDAELAAGDRTATAKVTSTGLAEDGKPCVDIGAGRDLITALGGVTALTEPGSVTAAVKWQSDKSTSLIPTGALRGAEGDYYVYVTQAENMDAGGRNASSYTISRKNVTVLGQSGSVTSVSESLQNDTLVYMEDRPLSDGCEVMPYDGV